MQKVYRSIGFYNNQAQIDNNPKTAVQAYPGDLQYADLNKDGVIDGYDMEVTGYSTIPNTVYGFQLGLNYKGFSMNAFFQGAANVNLRAVAEAIRPFSSNMMDIHNYAWTPALGNNALFPRLSLKAGASDAIGYPSTFYFVSGSYLRMKTAELGYNLPKRVVKAFGVQGVKLYANGYNLFTITSLSKLYEFDPEITTNTDRVNYPPQRIYNFGANINF